MMAASCDKKKSTESARPGEPRVRGVTASLGRAESGERGIGSIPSTWSECCPRRRSRCTVKKGVSLKATHEKSCGCWTAHLRHDLAILGQFEVLGQLWGHMSVSRNSRCGPLLEWFFLLCSGSEE